MKGNEAGPIGAIIVSGLPQQEDHQVSRSCTFTLQRERTKLMLLQLIVSLPCTKGDLGVANVLAQCDLYSLKRSSRASFGSTVYHCLSDAGPYTVYRMHDVFIFVSSA